jgi:hypothetical protein
MITTSPSTNEICVKAPYISATCGPKSVDNLKRISRVEGEAVNQDSLLIIAHEPHDVDGDCLQASVDKAIFFGSVNMA